MLISEIITYADRYYPNATTDANCIIDINTIHKAVYNKIIRLKNIYETYTSYTVANQLTYTLPTGCLPENILKIQISSAVTGSIDENTVWTTYDRATLSQDVSEGYWWNNMSEDVIIVCKDGKAIDTSNYEIKFFFFPDPTVITATTDTPDLDAEYHDLLCYGLIRDIASQGANPDTMVANKYEAEYQQRLVQIEKALGERYADAPIEDNRLKSRW